MAKVLAALWGWLQYLDRILRGEATRMETLRSGKIEVPAGGLAVVLLILATLYGLCMGTFGLLRGSWLQLVATTIKLPTLFFLTLLVTFPSLYVFNALVGSRLSIVSLLRLLIAALGVNLAMLAALGPIVAFFSVSTTSYHFIVLLNVFVFGVSGLLGLVFLLQTLNRLSTAGQLQNSPKDEPKPVGQVESEVEQPNVELASETQPPPGALDRLEGQVLGKQVKNVFRVWVLVFGLVGAQMSWVLRPFVGDPTLPFQWFRVRESNFFQAVIESLTGLVS